MAERSIERRRSARSTTGNVWPRWQAETRRNLTRPSLRIREFNPGAHWQRSLPATATRYLRRDDGFDISGQQIRPRSFASGMAECAANTQLVGEELAASR